MDKALMTALVLAEGNKKLLCVNGMYLASEGLVDRIVFKYKILCRDTIA